MTTGPDRTALIDDGHLVTYRALSARANRLSNHLRGLGVGPEVRVGLCMERSAELVVGLLGILKAGGVYVPLDPAYPKERLAFMVADAGLEVLVTEERHVPGLPDTSARVVSLDASREAISREREVAPAVEVSADNAAYVIYTSGSTGKPKGVEVPHRGVLRLLFGGDYVTLGSDVVIPHLSSPTFDASTFEVWAPLLHGGQCVLYPERVPTPLSLARAIQKHGLNTMWLTSALFNAVVDEAPGLLAGVDQLLIGGEALSLNHVQRALAALPSTTIINGYGPTESTTFACCHPIPVALRTTTQSIPIGRPIGNTTVNVLDAHMQPVPLGASGEVLIGGAGLARGYLDRADLTAERFVPDPYGAHTGGRVYRTGDVARYLPDGNVEFLGRVDHQVKLRGFRIELGEIEAVLRDHPALRDAVVVVREDAPGQARLVAYTVAHAQSPDVSEVRNYLKASLPDYMVPSAFVALDALPLTPNGKVDRRALPDPSPERPATPESLVAARSPQEEIISGIWAEVLGIERVGVHDDFFEFGGHSLLATQVMSRVRNAFQVELPLRVLFEAPTIAGLSEKLTAAIRANRELDSPPIVPRSREGELPLSFAQQRLWLLDRMRPGDSSYNVSAAIRLRGRLDAAALDQTFSEICRRQDVLRANFVDVDGRPVQVNRPARPLVLPLVDLSNLEGPAREAQATDLVERETARSFDLARDSLIRLHLLRMGDEDHVLLFSTHHIICDGWSVGVIVGELSSLYVRFTGGGPSSLEELKVQYSDFAGWQRDWLQGKALEAQLSYWRTQLGADPPRLALPTDRPRPQVETLQGQTYTVVLPASLTTRLKALSRAEGVTTFMTLLAAFKAQLQRYTGQDDIVVGTDMANRNRQEIEGLIGFFINLLVLRTDLGGNPSFRQLLKRVREKALEAYAHQDLPFDRLVEELQPERHLSDTPLFQVLFVLQNTPTSDLRLGGLLVQPVPLPSTTSKFDLAVFVSEGDAGISVTWQFKTDLFERSTITRIAQHFERVLESVVDDPEQPIGRLRLVEEKKKPERIRRTRPQAAALPDVGILASDDS
ncbi:MAG TPA: amino acid adenylation domain-containing protein [Vicinamibacterales bacterium]|nr:amino acid adenylation domain-containing protein [Vicinamibacterales bacterium]